MPLPNGTSNPPPALPPLAEGSSSSATITTASSLASIQNLLSSLHTRESAITTRLQHLITSQADLSRELGRLDLLRAHLGTNLIQTRSISNSMLDNASNTASKLSSQVKQLDLEKQRVEETLSVVEQVAELKACVQGVVGSMGAPQDWEAAAGYIARASKIPTSIVEGNFAARTVPSVEVPDAPGITIESAKESLCGLFLREFQKAAEEGDGVRVTRFFKLFPLIGREETGLDVYGRYVCQGVAGTARGNLRDRGKDAAAQGGFFYANALTKLFEHIAQIVEGHGGLVERHYGKGRMVKVIEKLQVEADVQGGIVLDTWGDERNIDRRLTDVKSYPFSFLVQSFLSAQRPSGIARTSSPAQGGAANGRNSEDEGVDMKEVDGLLSETAIMLGRWSLYTRFLAGKCRDPENDADEPLIMPDLLAKSALSRKISARLITPFEIMTTFFFRRSVEKAFQLDESPTGLSLNPSKSVDGNGPFIISAVDDVMYIVNTVLQRSISTSQRDVIASVIPAISRVLGSEFIGMIQRKMRDESYPKASGQNSFPPEDKIIAFIILMNSLDVSKDYISRIVSSRLASSDVNDTSSTKAPPPPSLKDLFPFSHDATFVTSALTGLQTSFSSKSSELINEAVSVLINQVIKPRIRPILSDTFRDIDYSDPSPSSPQDDDEDTPPDPDLVPHRFSTSWTALMTPLSRLLTPSLYSTILDKTAEYLADRLERRIWSGSLGKRISAEGAQRLERDMGGIVGAVARGARYGVRDAFVRVQQVAMVCSMDEEEWIEVSEVTGDGEGEGEGEEMVWVLSLEERTRARGLVTGGGEDLGRQRMN